MAEEKATNYQSNETYLVKIKSVTATTSKNKGTPGFRVSVEGTMGDVEGQVLTDTVWVTEKTKWKMSNLLSAVGLSTLPGRDDVTLFKTFYGKEILIKTVVEEGRENPLGGKYPDTIRIANFLGGSKQVSTSKSANDDGNVPF